ncbi:MAG: dihydropteroate synthase [Bacteroidia bacterium]|nr:dihydropteroate synthase [Bacteroidia bacterium]
MEISTIFGHSAAGNATEKYNPLIMGILNLTPDSFYDGGHYLTQGAPMKRAEAILEAGGTIIDLGAVSTRPGAKEVDEATEWHRIAEPLQQIRRNFPAVLLSVDTWRASIAKKALDNGADIINDISGGMLDPEMIPFIATTHAAYVLMHMKGTPATMQNKIYYDDVTREVSDFLQQQATRLSESGFTQIILDPGFGFGKTTEHNYQLLQDLHRIKKTGYPVLVGISRKSMIHKVLKSTPEEALTGTIVLNTIALLLGADILRVHDVREAAESIKIIKMLPEMPFRKI